MILMKVIVKDKEGKIREVLEQRQNPEHIRAYYIPMVLRRGMIQALERGFEVSLELEVKK